MKKMICPYAELRAKGKLRVIVNERPLLVVAFDGKAYAIADKCPHKGAPLSLGKYDDGVIQCKEHGLQVNVTTGQVVMGLKAKLLVPQKDSQSVRTYAATVEDGNVYVEI